MPSKELFEDVGKYIDKYYHHEMDDIKMDKEMRSIFDKISLFREKRKQLKIKENTENQIEIDESMAEEFDESTMAKVKFTKSMSRSRLTANSAKIHVFNNCN